MIESALLGEHPCIAGWKSDAEIWLRRAHYYVECATTLETGPEKDYNIIAAEKMVEAAEECIKKIEGVR